PQRPQARNVWFATATAAAAATTHGLAGHSHYGKRVRGIVPGVNDLRLCEKTMTSNTNFDAGLRCEVTRYSKKGFAKEAHRQRDSSLFRRTDPHRFEERNQLWCRIDAASTG